MEGTDDTEKRFGLTTPPILPWFLRIPWFSFLKNQASSVPWIMACSSWSRAFSKVSASIPRWR